MNNILRNIKKYVIEILSFTKQEIVTVDYIEVNKNDKVIIKRLSTYSSRTQSMYLLVDKPKNKKCLRYKGKKINGLYFHEIIIDKNGEEITILEDNVTIAIKNRGSEWGWNMLVIKKNDKRTYYTSGSIKSNIYKDLIFEITIKRADK